jgi:predicted CXXCH cytochrome family protein
MRLGPGLLAAGCALFAWTFSVKAISQSAPPQPPPVSPAPLSTERAEYVGSEACARCHQADYDAWKRSLHVRMTKPIADADVLGDFSSNARLSAHGRAFEFGERNGRPFMRVSFGGRPPETFRVDYTLGFKRYQGYLATLDDGRMYVLPAFWHVESKRWLDWKEITPIPDGAHDLRQIWNSNCFNCHATNLARGFDVTTRTFKTTWTEMGIGCEACHGPGRRHIEVIDASLKDPSLKPGGTLEIYTSASGSARQSFDTCGYCHGNKRNVFVGFTAGSRFEDFALPFLISAPIPETDRQGEFWPDGRPNRFNRTQALTMSGCFKAGEVACTSCHVAHGSPYPFSLRVDITKGTEGDTLCTQCHSGYQAPGSGPQAPGLGLQASGSGLQAPGLGLQASGSGLQAPGSGLQAPGSGLQNSAGSALERHTFHAASSEGSRCINCHMSDVNWRLLIRRRDHTFAAPVPEITAAYGVPNACTTCHDGRTPEWAARQMDVWWNNGERRRAAVSVADTMYRAGSGDASVIPQLARLAVDRAQGLLVRASAVEFLERFAEGTIGVVGPDAQSQTSFAQAPGSAKPSSVSEPQAPRQGPQRVTLTPAQINALIGAAADPEPTVRAHAVGALLATDDRERILAPLTARLMDPARVVRARVAEGLLMLGIVELPGAAGALLARAQNEYAQALLDFPDIAANHTELGWLLTERGQPAAALRALEDAIRLDPNAARPFVIRGVIAAREGKYAEAVGLWRKARSLDPAYPNIDRLIAEAEKRR